MQQEPRDGRERIRIEYRCAGCGERTAFDAETFDLSVEPVCPVCGRRIFGGEEASDLE